jgi:fatty acid desaturase
MTAPPSSTAGMHSTAEAPVDRFTVPRELLAPSTTAQLLRMAVEEWLMIALIAVASQWVSPWSYPVVLVLLSGRYHALGVILHDAAHTGGRRPRTGGRLLLELLCGFPIGTTLAAMRYHHLRHHRDHGGAEDPYYKHGEQSGPWWFVNTLRGAFLYPFWLIRSLVGVVAFFAPPARTAYARVFLQDRSRADVRNSREVIATARAEFLLVVWCAAVIPLYLAFPRAMLAFHLAPVTLAGVLSARRLLIEHRYDAAMDCGDAYSSTRDNHLNWLGAIALAPRNVGYHVAHHLHPRAGLAVLPRLREWYRRQYPEHYR